VPRKPTLLDEQPSPLLAPSQVAELFGVNVKTVTRWAARGLLPAVTTPGGHRRYRESDIRRLLHADTAALPG
jgi:excisionase family DNA binding protein